MLERKIAKKMSNLIGTENLGIREAMFAFRFDIEGRRIPTLRLGTATKIESGWAMRGAEAGSGCPGPHATTGAEAGQGLNGGASGPKDAAEGRGTKKSPRRALSVRRQLQGGGQASPRTQPPCILASGWSPCLCLSASQGRLGEGACDDVEYRTSSLRPTFHPPD